MYINWQLFTSGIRSSKTVIVSAEIVACNPICQLFRYGLENSKFIEYKPLIFNIV